MAAQAAAAIEGARLQESMTARKTQLSAISEVSKTITSNLYLEEILQLHRGDDGADDELQDLLADAAG